MSMKKHLILSVALIALGIAPIAAHAEATHVRGKVVSLDGTKLVVHSREGADVIITLADKFAVTGVVKATLADLKPGTFVGTASMPQADGTLKSLELVIFPEALRSRGEGHRPWDLQPNSKMTNGNVDAAVKSVDGETLTLSYKGGEQKITVTEATPIVTFGAATVADIIPGAVVFVPGDKMPDGSVDAKAVVVGKDGVVPPM